MSSLTVPSNIIRFPRPLVRKPETNGVTRSRKKSGSAGSVSKIVMFPVAKQKADMRSLFEEIQEILGRRPDIAPPLTPRYETRRRVYGGDRP